jgi:CHASE1-domain containing sensor protein
VIVESKRGFEMAYAGLIIETNWNVFTKSTDDKTLSVFSIFFASILGLAIIAYVWIGKVYN